MEKNNFYTVNPLANNINSIHQNEFHNYISEIGFVSFQEARSFLFSDDLELLEENDFKAIIIAGRSKLLHLEGDLASSLKLSNIALRIARKLNTRLKKQTIDDCLAYVLLEKGVLHRKLFEEDKAIEMFSEALSFAHSEKLKLLLSFQIELLNATRYEHYNLGSIKNCLEEVRQANLKTAYFLGVFRYCDLLIKHREYQNALNQLELIKNEVDDLGYNYVSDLIGLTEAFIYLLKQEYSKSISLFEKIAEKTKSHYILSFAFENIAACYYRLKEYQNAVDWCYKALDNSIDNNVVSQIPQECLFLGRIYNDVLGKSVKAKHFYQKGAEFAISHIQMGLTMSGFRKAAIEKFQTFLIEKFPEEVREKPKELKPDRFFKQFEGKTWAEITDIFDFNLIIYHRMKTHDIEQFLSSLGLKKPTYYSHHLKLKNKGFNFPDLRFRKKELPEKHFEQSIFDFIDRLDDKTWHSVKEKFEKEVIFHLYQVYGYKKTNLARTLKLSYQVVRKRTESFS